MRRVALRVLAALPGKKGRTRHSSRASLRTLSYMRGCCVWVQSHTALCTGSLHAWGITSYTASSPRYLSDFIPSQL